MTAATATTAPRRCSIAAALGVIGEKWSLLVIRELFLGVRRFNDIAVNTGAPRDILTARLRAGWRNSAWWPAASTPSARRGTSTSSPTPGKDLRPVILALKQWGDDHVTDKPLPLVWEHTCGEVFVPRTHCAACGDPLDGRALTVRQGPAAKATA